MTQIKSANRKFVNGNYEEALKSYNDALVDAPHSSALHFNAGDAAYQMGDFSKADKEFQEAAQSAIPQLKAAAHYNRGNALFRQQRYDDAVSSYKESLRVNPSDADAKYNLSVALRAQKNPAQNQSQKQKQDQKQNEKGQQQKKPGEGDSQKKKDPGDNQQESGGKQPKPGEMSREDVERLLAAAKSSELKKPNQKFPKTDVPHPEEDW